MTAASVRARVRAEMTEEIKAAARRHLAADGANLSLRAVARDLGMVSSAVYRYFASRDDLLTALIIDSYNALGEAAEAAEASADRADVTARWLATCHGVRGWALRHPHEYALIYGSPVPGYQAPQDTVPPATRIPLLIGGILRDAVATTAVPAGDPLPERLRADLTGVRDLAAPGVPEEIFARGMTAWIQLFGAVSFELFGQLNNTVVEREAFFDHQMRTMARLIGLP
ncbi:MAG TPA: TetR/AcrR family transcriptional regulator [Pilimelia sp.]|nr:TetR/AcrR family transcriptional regulator [Pilimelia sp.]